MGIKKVSKMINKKGNNVCNYLGNTELYGKNMKKI